MRECDIEYDSSFDATPEKMEMSWEEDRRKKAATTRQLHFVQCAKASLVNGYVKNCPHKNMVNLTDPDYTDTD